MKKLTDQDPETKSADLLAENVIGLKALFPEAFVDGKVDFDVLKQLLGGAIDTGEEKYGLNWHGKRQARQIALTPSTGTLRPAPEDSVDWDTTQNLMIEGDNLEVLKLLQKSYAGKVKVIYIDPPYNTGSDFVYPDDFQDSIKNYLMRTGQIDSDGRQNVSNTESSGRLHTEWLNMMYPRLKLARNLLADDGVMFISIDDGEVDNLKKLCTEIFGGENFVAQFPWRKRTAKSDVPFGVSQDFEWLLCVAKSDLFVACIDGGERKYFESVDLPDRPWRIHDMTKQTSAKERPNSYFTMVNPKNGKKYPANPGSVWRITKDTFQQYYDQQRIVFPGDYDFLNISNPVFRYFKEDDEAKAGEMFGFVTVSTLLPKEVGMTQDGTKDIAKLFDQKAFAFPKPVGLIKYLIQITTSIDKKALILDFFSGSATTAQAALTLNVEDGGNRRFIMVQLPEICGEGSDAFEAGFKNIAEIGKERVRRAARQLQKDSPEYIGDLGFRVFKLDSSNIRAWEPNREELTLTLEQHAEHLKTDRTENDILFELLLKLGLDLTVPIEEKTIVGKAVYSIGAGTLIVCLSNQLATAEVEPLALGIVKWYKQLAPAGETQLVFRDSAFADDVAKTNMAAILHQNGLENIKSL
ncbi:MAG: site-specific DNA-methyltransferase [Dehalogenimonas sp.]